jgi:hypothetical protein
MTITVNNVKDVRITDEHSMVRVIKISTTCGDYMIFLKKSASVKRLNIKRQKLENA